MSGRHSTSVLITALLFSCQTYEPKSLDLSAYRDSVTGRSEAGESLIDFVERLRGSGVDAPERFDLADGVSLPEGEVLALFFNPDLRLARAQAGIALADLETVGRWQDPEFGFNGAELLSPDGAFEFGLTLSLTLPVSGRLALEKERASAAYETTLRGIVDAEWSTRFSLRQAWGTWTTAKEKVRLLREIVVTVERINSITNKLLEAEEISRVEGRLFPIELNQRKAALLQAVLEEQQAESTLLGLMGLAADARLDLTPQLTTPPPPVSDDPIGQLIQFNTTLAVRRAAYRTAEQAVQLEVRKQYPDLTIGSGYGSEDHDDRLLLGLSLPIPILNANRAGIADARAKRELARVEAYTTFESLARDLNTSIVAYESLTNQRTRYESEIIPLLEEQSSEAEKIAEIGAVDALLLLSTVTSQFDAKSRLLDLRLAELKAGLKVAELLGQDNDLQPAPVNKVNDEPKLEAAPKPANEGGP